MQKFIVSSSHLRTAPRASAASLWAVLFALCAGIFPMARPAQAQVQVQTAVVLDFSVAPGIDPILGRKAADALAVELQRSGDYEIVPRATVEQKIADEPGLVAPFNEYIQARLAQATSARTVFSGQVMFAQVNQGRAARVTVETRLLDATTQDFINGTTVSEATEEQLGTAGTEVLLDQAINKCAVTAVRKIKQNVIPAGTVLNTTVEDAETSVGTRIGAVVGQRYSVLRDVYNRSKDKVERVKIGELVINKVEMDQSIGRIYGNSIGGIKSGDKVRMIFAPSSYPVSPSVAGGVAGLPNTNAYPGSTGRKDVKSKAGGLLGGGAALLVLATLFGFGGGGGDSTTAPGRVTSRASTPLPSGSPTISVSYTDGVPRITVPARCIVGFFIYRGQSPEATIDTRSPIDFQFGTTTQYIDDIDRWAQRVVTVARPTATTNSDPCPPPTGIVNNTTFPNTAPGSTFTSGDASVNTTFSQEPLVPGVQFFYRVRRLNVERRTIITGTTSTTQFDLILSEASDAAGPTTTLIRPVVLGTGGSFDTNFQVRIDGTSVIANQPPTGAGVPAQIVVSAFSDNGIRFLLQLSNNPDFSTGVFEIPQPNKAPEATGEITFNLGQVLATGVDIAEPVFIRVGVTNPNDQIPQTIFGLRQQVTFGVPSIGARSVSSKGAVRQVGGAGLPNAPGGRSTTRSTGGGVRRAPAGVSRPR